VAPSADPRDALIAELTKLVNEQREEIERLKERAAELEKQIKDKNSRNSSKPPSSDGPGVERPKPKATGRKRGGQPGHQGTTRVLLPVEAMNEVKRLVPSHCGRCSEPLDGVDPNPWRHQVTELPKIEPHRTEYQSHALTCRCGAVTREPLPSEVIGSSFGPRLTATVAMFTGQYRLSKRMVPALLRDLAGIEVADGSVCQLERHVSDALALAVDAAREAVQSQDRVHLDESGWRQASKRAWLWVAVTAVATVFRISQSRGAKVAREILGDAFAGRIITDRWSAYTWVPSDRRQICWAHLIRDFQWMVDAGGSAAPLAQKLLDRTRQLFELWHRFRDGHLSRDELRAQAAPRRKQIERLLARVRGSGDRDPAGMCREILLLAPALWAFIDVDGVPPTNNAAERAIRPAVIWRKTSFGTDSVHGSLFVERILTTTATLRAQQRNVLDFLTDTVEATRFRRPTPSLLASASGH
jgi:transposase